MGLHIERDEQDGSISGISVTPEMPESLSAEEALLTVILDPTDENMLSGARHHDARVRFAVALHPKMTESVAVELAEGGTDNVKQALASNLATPMDVLEELGEAEDLVVANAALKTMVARLRSPGAG